MLEKKDFFKIGNIQKPHGIKGEVIIHFDEEIADKLEGHETIFIDIEGGLVPFFISNYRIKSMKSAIVIFQLAKSEEEINEITGKPVFLEKRFQDELVNEEYEFIDVTGFILIDNDNHVVGTVKSVIENPDNPLLEVDTTQNDLGIVGSTEVLIPFQDELLIDINETEKWIKIQLPKGLLDL